MQLHMDLRAAKLRGQGADEDVAARNARRRFGNPAAIHESSRDTWGWRWLEEAWLDSKLSLRMLAKAPGFASIVVLTLGLGIGAATAIFNVVNGVLLESLPYREPNRLMLLYEKFGGPDAGFSPPDYLVLTRQREWFASIGAFNNVELDLSGSVAPERVTGARLTASLFQTLGVDAALGRSFTDAEDQEGAAVALLSHAYWSRRFGRDPSVIGRGIQVNGRLRSIIGVLPPNLVFPPRGLRRNAKPADVFLPMSFTAGQRLAYGSNYNNTVVARLNPGVSIERLNAAAPALMRSVGEPYPASLKPLASALAVSIVPFHDDIVGNVRTMLWLMLSASVAVLLIGCANVANLMLARATGRSREMAVRVALGAGRFRLIRQVLVESSVLAFAGGALGVLLAAILTGALTASSPVQIPRSEAIVMSQRALLFATAVSMLTALLFGLVPALETSRSAPSLREVRHGRTSSVRWLRSFVTVQVAAAVVLSVGAGLLVRSLTKLLEVDPGFRPEQVLGFSLNLPARSYPGGAQMTAFWEKLRAELSLVPGAEAVGFGDLPLAVRDTRAITAEDPSGLQGQRPGVRQAFVHGEFFRALGVPLVKGRWFTDHDSETSQPVVIVNDTMARLFYPGRDAIGQRLKFGLADSTRPWMTVVGVVGDFKQESLQERTSPMTFTPLMQEPSQSRAMHVALRVSGDPSAVTSAIRKAVANLDPSLPVAELRKMDDAVRQAGAPQRFSTYLLGAFAGIALLLATLGIAGVVAFSVSQRSREIGLRVALGATRGTILSLVLREGLTYAGIGVVVGVGLALGLTRLMSSLLFGVQATDPVTFAGVTGVVALVSAAASLLPALRATRVDPIVALRNE
jgi:putative ABC transport system permease protein